jgi:Zn-dependent M28 family amino/carboxypeptidase
LEGTREPDKVIVVCAHHDCQGASGFPPAIDCPGAQDNASGCAALLELGKYFAKGHPRKTIEFITFGGEEWGLLLSKEYVRFLKDSNRLEKVLACVNLDEVAKGPYFSASGEEPGLNPRINMQRLVTKVLKDMHLPDSLVGPPIASSDHWPFYLEGKPFVYIHPSEYEQYHRSNDVYPDAVEPEAWKKSLTATRMIVEELLRTQ